MPHPPSAPERPSFEIQQDREAGRDCRQCAWRCRGRAQTSAAAWQESLELSVTQGKPCSSNTACLAWGGFKSLQTEKHWASPAVSCYGPFLGGAQQHPCSCNTPGRRSEIAAAREQVLNCTRAPKRQADCA